MNTLMEKINTIETNKKDADNKTINTIVKTNVKKDQTCLKMLDYFLF